MFIFDNRVNALVAEVFDDDEAELVVEAMNNYSILEDSGLLEEIKQELNEQANKPT